MPTQEQARQWLDRWDRQQEVYIADREERFAVISDVVRAALARPDPLIVDLGAGPGSLSVRLLDQLPGARVVAVDADPLLLGLADAAYGDRAGLRMVAHDLRHPGWVSALDLDRAPDAIVSTTALHWLTLEELDDVYRSAAGLLAAGGVLVNGDHLPEATDRPILDRLTRSGGVRISERVGRGEGDDWAQWWAAVATAPELAELSGRRGARPIDHSVAREPTVDDHERLLRAAGFTEVGPVWQHGDDRVLVAVR